MKKNLSMIACVIDRSGSMEPIQDDAIGGFNRFLQDQKEQPGEAKLTLVLFDHEYNVVCELMALDEVKPLDKKTYVPRGNTALLDAVGRTIDTLGDKLEAMPDEERPETVICAILTDGQENASTEQTLKSVARRIKTRQEEDGWKFVFLAANQDAFTEASKMGIDQQFTSGFVSDSAGTNMAYTTMSRQVSSIRIGRSPDDEDEESGS